MSRASGKGNARTPPGSAPPAAPVRAGRGRRLAFRFLALLSPLLLLGLVELGLRLAGAGYPTSFFLRVQDKGETRLVENARFGWRFFPPNLARSPEPLSFAARKPANTLRIFVFGESAALGDPEPAYGMPRQLERLLQARHPERKIEVINVAMTAINSHVIREIARDCAGADGDCWVLYPGNNEVVGPFGAGTIFGKQAAASGVVRANLAMKTTRLGQLLAGLGQAKSQPAEWMGMEMFLEQQISWSDTRLNRVYQNYGRNLADIVGFARRAGVKIVLSTMAVNLKDCPPFNSSHGSGLTSRALREWERTFNEGQTAEEELRYPDAIGAFTRAISLDPAYAESYFRRGACELAAGDASTAAQDFRKARDLDTLRFRADSELNDIVRRTARVTQGGFLDAEALCGNAGTTGTNAETSARAPAIPGDSLFYDHVHLNFSGNYWLASLLVPEIERQLFPDHSALPPLLAEQEIARRLAWTDYDRSGVYAEVRARLQQPPFNAQIHAQQRDQLWEERVKSLSQDWQAPTEAYRAALKLVPGDWVLHARFARLLQAAGNTLAASAEWAEVMNLLPREPEAFFQLGNLAQDGGDFGEAERFFRAAIERNSRAVEALNGLGLLARSKGDSDQARTCFEAALRVNPRFEAARLNLAVLLADSGRAVEAQAAYEGILGANSNSVPARVNLAKLLVERGDRDGGLRLYQEAVKLQPDNAAAQFGLGHALCAQQRNGEAIPHYQAAVRANPPFADARYNLGLELARTGRIPEALEQFREVVRLKPADADARFNYGVALAREQRYAEAMAEFRETLKLNPRHPSAAAMLERAQRLQPAAK